MRGRQRYIATPSRIRARPSPLSIRSSMPRKDWQDMDADSVEFAEVLGWKFEQFREMFARQRTMESLGVEWDGALPRRDEG